MKPTAKHAPLIKTDESNANIYRTPAKIGVCKGVTRNMDNYESLRVDVWFEDYVKDDETVEHAYVRLGAIVDRELQNQVESILEE